LPVTGGIDHESTIRYALVLLALGVTIVVVAKRRHHS
jgi:hypothetical protein